MTRRVLIVAPYFPPRRRVGAQRPFRFATHLRQAGWQPSVVYLQASGLELTETERRLLHGVELLPLGAPLDTTQRLASGGLDDHNTKAVHEDNAQQLGAPKKPAGLLSRAALSLREEIDSAIPLDSWAPVLWLHAKRLIPKLRMHPPDVVWSTADPWSSHWLGMELGRRLHVPWVADFRDPWTLCPIRSRVPNWTQRVNQRFEAQIMDRAAAVTFTAERTRDNYAHHYTQAASRMHCIRNGFDSAQLVDPILGPFESPAADKTLNVVFFGRFRPLSPATAIIEALAHIQRRAPACLAKIRVHCVASLAGADFELATSRGVIEQFRPLTPVPYERSLSAIRSHDLALLSTATERDDIVPAKLWEYLAAGSPILSLTPNPEVASILQQVNGGVQLDPRDPSAIADLLIRCCESKSAGRPLPIPARAADDPLTQFDAPHLTRQLATLLARVAK